MGDVVRNIVFLGHVGSGKTEILRKLGVVDEAGGNIREYKFSMLEFSTHAHYVQKLMTRADDANIGVLVVSAAVDDLVEDVKTFQTLEYVFLINTLGLSKIIVVINKMDMIDWSKIRFDDIKSELSVVFGHVALGYYFERDVEFIPLSGISKTNIKTELSGSTCPWWKGPFLLKALEASQALSVVPKNKKEKDISKDEIEGFAPYHVRLKKYVEELTKLDLSLDGDPTNEKLWGEKE